MALLIPPRDTIPMMIKIDTAFHYKFVHDAILSAFEPAVSIDDYGRSALAVGDFLGNANIFDYLQVYDSTGTLMYSKSVTGMGTVNFANVNFRAVVFPKLYSNELYLAGDYKNEMTIDGTNLTCIQSNNYEIALIKLSLPSQLVTGINFSSPGNEELIIAPNPFTSQTTITFNEIQTNTLIKITDILGKEVKRQLATGKSATLDMSGFARGIYFVQITNTSIESAQVKNGMNRKIIMQ